MKISDQIYVHWQHKQEKKRKSTTCIVEKNGLVFTAVARASHGDEFRKSIGRKISLARAIAEYSKEERSFIWNKLIESGVSFM